MPVVTVIEFTDIECRVLHGDAGRGRLTARAMFSIPLPRNEDAARRVAERSQLLREALRARKLRPQRVRVLIPKNYVMARTVLLPAANDAELEGMARFEAERHIPFNAERHIVSHCVLRRQGVEGIEVLLAAADEPIATEYVDICTRAGLRVESLGVSSLALHNAFVAAAPGEVSSKVAAIVSIGAAGCEFALSRDGNFTFTRGASVGTERLLAELRAAGLCPPGPEDGRRPKALLAALDAMHAAEDAGRPAETPPPLSEESIARAADEPGLTGNESSVFEIPSLTQESNGAVYPSRQRSLIVHAWLQALLREIRRTLEFARREYNLPPVDCFHLCGEGALLNGLAPFLEKSLGVPARILNVFETFEAVSGALAADETPLAYTACAGEALLAGAQGLSVNLLPAAYLEKTERRRQQHSWIVTGIMFLVLLLLGYMYVSKVFTAKNELLVAYIEKNREMKSRVDDLRAKEVRLDIIRRFIQDEHGALDVLERISAFNFIPSQVTLTGIEYKKEEYIKLRGHAKTLPDVNRMRLELEQTGFFQSVALDDGSNKPVRLPNRADQVLEWYITATFPKRDAKKGARQTASSPSAAPAQPAPSAETNMDGTTE
jgi:type IV pilus assembly protein PilM